MKIRTKKSYFYSLNELINALGIKSSKDINIQPMKDGLIINIVSESKDSVEREKESYIKKDDQLEVPKPPKDDYIVDDSKKDDGWGDVI